jgi:ketosteroid isomerase-like protein
MLCLLPVIAAAACSQGPRDPQFTQNEANQIRQRTQEYKTAFNSKEAKEVLAFYTDESILMPPNAPTVRGKDSIQTFYSELYGQGATDLEMETKDIRGQGTLSYETGSYTLIRRPPSGGATRDRGKYVFIWRNNGNGWKIEYTIWSSDLPKFVPIGS